MVFYFALTTIILTVVLTLHNFRFNKNCVYLAGYLLPISLFVMANYYFFESDSVIGVSILFGNAAPLYHLSAPMLYFYTKGTIDDTWKFSYSDYWHFIPFLLGIINISPYYFVDFSQKIIYAKKLIEDPNFHRSIDITLLYPSYIQSLGRPFLILIYSIISLNYLIKQKAYFLSYKPLEMRKTTYRWLTFLTVNAILISIMYLIVTYNYFSLNLLTRDQITNNVYSIIAKILIFSMPAILLFYPQLIYGHSVTITSNIGLAKKSIKQNKNSQNKNNLQLAKHMMSTINDENLYLNPDFSLETLAQRLDVPKHRLYPCFNTVLKKKFSELRTELRINYVKNLLLSEELNAVSMEGIWTKAGFSSKTNFFTTFKEETGFTPLEFIKLKKDKK
jgi:AraC-like DNA-binding protein